MTPALLARVVRWTEWDWLPPGCTVSCTHTAGDRHAYRVEGPDGRLMGVGWCGGAAGRQNFGYRDCEPPKED